MFILRNQGIPDFFFETRKPTPYPPQDVRTDPTLTLVKRINQSRMYADLKGQPLAGPVIELLGCFDP